MDFPKLSLYLIYLFLGMYGVAGKRNVLTLLFAIITSSIFWQNLGDAIFQSGGAQTWSLAIIRLVVYLAAISALDCEQSEKAVEPEVVADKVGDKEAQVEDEEEEYDRIYWMTFNNDCKKECRELGLLV